MPLSPRSLPLLLTLLLAVLATVLVPGAPPLAGVVVAAGLLHRLVVAHQHRHRLAALPAVVPVAPVAVAPAAP